VLSVDVRVDVADLVEAGDTVVAIGHIRGYVRATGASFDVHLVHVWTVREGRLIGLDARLDLAAMLGALGNPERRAVDAACPTYAQAAVADRCRSANGSGHWRTTRAAALARVAG
jgi:hypothetical protein